MQATVNHNLNHSSGYKVFRVEINETAKVHIMTIGSEAAFEQLFKLHYKALHAYACTILNDNMGAEEIVQQVFLKIWERRERLNIEGSLKAYLYRAVHNDCLNVIKHEKIKHAYKNFATNQLKNETDHASKKVLLGDLEKKLRIALNELPEQCRTIFQMSRFEELRYQEIADRLGLSVKTIENQMGKALKLMRIKLSEFLPLILLSLYHL